MKKRYLYIIIVLLLSIIFISCSNKKDNDDPKFDDKCILTVDYQKSVYENKTIEFKYNDIVTLPTCDDKDFYGWTFDLMSKEVIKTGFMIHEDLTIYALYKTKEELKETDLTEIEFKTDDTEIYKVYKDLTFKVVESQEIKLDIYYPSSSDVNKPVLFSYFGGGWVAGSKESTYLISLYNKLLAKGYVIVAPNYRLCNAKVKYPDPVCDTLDAIRYIVKYKDTLKIDTNNMGSIGFSSGAHLALMAAFAQDYFKDYEPLAQYNYKLKYVVDMFAPSVFDLDELKNLSSMGLFYLTSYMGSTDLEHIEGAEKMFPSYYVGFNNPNTFIVHGMSDEVVPATQSIAFKKMLDEKGINAEIVLVEGSTHMLSPSAGVSKITPSFSEIIQKIADFILSNR